MSRSLDHLLQCLCICLFLFLPPLVHVSLADVGTAAQYSPPYLPTSCYGEDVSRFPGNNMFAAGGEGIWNSGAACGRQYLVRCLSATEQGTCVDGLTIQITIVDRALDLPSQSSADGATMVLSATAFAMIANDSASIINIEFQQRI